MPDPAPPGDDAGTEALRSLVRLVTDEPERRAVGDPEGWWTYEDLGARVGSVAAFVASPEMAHRPDGAPGVGPDGEVPLPVLVDRSREAFATVLGVLVGGRAFCGIESTDPPGRLAELLERLGATVVLLPPGAEGAVLPPGVTGVRVRELAAAAPVVVPRRLDDLFSVVFTSGSTGVPKGVVLERTSLAHQAQRSRIRMAIDGDGPSPSTSLLSFVASHDALTDVCLGRPIHRIDPFALGPEAYLGWLDEQGFDNIALVPSHARAVVSRWPAERRLRGVRNLLTYGEALTWADVVMLRCLTSDDVTISAVYASSEAGTVAQFVLRRDSPLGGGRMPLGEVLPGKAVRLEPVDDSPGAPDEIVVVGVGARGYWGDPELSAARFGVDPDGRRTWRSGDLGAVVDGVVCHVGRVDDLVKVGGRLVEPAEAERALRAQPGIAGAVVLAQRLGGRDRLVGHVVPDPDLAVHPLAVRDALRALLPSALLPAVLVRHEHLPLTPRGKTDRVALRAVPVVPWVGEGGAALSTAAEWEVAALLAEVLELAPEVTPCASDDVFALGLDSLAATELLEALRAEGLASLTMADLVAHPTVAGLAALIDASLAALADVDVEPESASASVSSRGVWSEGSGRLRRSGVGSGSLPGSLPGSGPGSAPASRRRSGGPVVLRAGADAPPGAVTLHVVAGAGGTALEFRALAAALGDRWPVVVHEAPGLHDERPVPRSVGEAAEALRREVTHDPAAGGVGAGEPLLLVGHSLGGNVAQEAARRLHRRGQSVAVLVLDAFAPHGGLWPRWRAARGALGRVRRGEPLRRTATWRPPPGISPVERYQWFYEETGRSLAYHRTRRSPIPLTVVEAGPRPHQPSFARPAGTSWQRYAPEVRVVPVAGDHNTMLEPPHVAALAEVVRRWGEECVLALRA